MERKLLLKHLVYLMFFIFLANFLALKFFWYSLIWYFDIVMHFLGGVWVGMFFLYVFTRGERQISIKRLFLEVILATLVVGVLWEFYEYYLSVISGSSWDLMDTLSDMFFDFLGGIVAYGYLYKSIMSSQINKL